MILSQLVDADEMSALSPAELRDLLTQLDYEVTYGDSETLLSGSESEQGETSSTPSAES